jgi:hypothetical protein
MRKEWIATSLPKDRGQNGANLMAHSLGGFEPRLPFHAHANSDLSPRVARRLYSHVEASEITLDMKTLSEF